MKRVYKIETKGSVITLYRRRWRFFWFNIESRTFCYSQHRIKIMREWIKSTGRRISFPTSVIKIFHIFAPRHVKVCQENITN